jgi:hypothetical protein
MERNYSILNPDYQNTNQTDIQSNNTNSNIYHDVIYQDENIQQRNTVHSTFNQIQKEPNLFSVQRKALNQVSKIGNENYANFEEKPNVEKDFCEICCEDLLIGEVINYCLCSKFFHPNCLIYEINKTNINCSITSKNCSECGSSFNFANYKSANGMDSTNEKTFECQSLIDTNLNNLENYNEMRDIAFQISHENLAEIISKKNENHQKVYEEIGRIALSPITLNDTPYSGKTKKQISSNQKVEEYIRMQNTHTTPQNNRHVMMSGISELPEGVSNIYEQSPEVSFQGIRQQLSFNSPNNISTNINNNHIIHSNFVNQNPITTSHSLFNYNKSKSNNKNDQTNLDVEKFFKSINLELSGKEINPYYDTNLQNQTNLTPSNNAISFRKIVFEDLETEENNPEIFEDNYDKENTPPIPRESSKFSYCDPESVSCSSPVEINLEAGFSHINSDSQKVIEVPISIDFNLKESTLNICGTNSSPFNYSKDYIIFFNTKNLNLNHIYQIFKILYEKISDSDRVFSNIFRFENWLNKDEFKEILFGNQFEIYTNKETSILNFSEICKLMTYCIDLSFEHHSNIFSVVLINDVEDIHFNVDYYEELKIVSKKFMESKVTLIKNFTINCITIDPLKSEYQMTTGNVKSISFLYEICMLSMGYFFAPKDSNELNTSFANLISMIEQSTLLNMKANIKGNKDPVR